MLLPKGVIIKAKNGKSYQGEIMEIKVLKNILNANDQIAQKNRDLLDKNGVCAINIMSSPGAGKTSLILETIRSLKGKVRIGVIEGDVSSSVDAEAVGKEGVSVIQIKFAMLFLTEFLMLV